jgi:hypothetical protein
MQSWCVASMLILDTNTLKHCHEGVSCDGTPDSNAALIAHHRRKAMLALAAVNITTAAASAVAATHVVVRR